jgi:hypothetical protein
MSKISFKKLHELVANIDFCFEETHPVMFTVCQRGDEHYDGLSYLVGLAETIETEDGEEINGLFQFVKQTCNGKVIDLQEEESMEFEAIGKMLKDKCAIERGCTIYLEKDCSFSGDEYLIQEKDCYDKSVIHMHEEWQESLAEELAGQ